MKLSKSSLLEGLDFKQSLRYGENPHQEASWFTFPDEGLSNAKQIQGKELSYNNIIDLEAAISTVQEFKGQYAVVVVKHTNPCGVAIGTDIFGALIRALDGDRVSCFGGIIALNKTVTMECAEELIKGFYECIVAPKFSERAREVLSTKKNLRLLELDIDNINVNPYNIRSVLGGILVQEKDNKLVDSSEWNVSTERQPTLMERNDLTFAWKVVKHVRSNAIVIAHSGCTIGIGAGQMNRVGSCQIALNSGNNVNESVLASDVFFPFDDTVRMASEYGIKAIVQPGGSIKDQESIDACNELGMTMIFTGKRHFLH